MRLFGDDLHLVFILILDFVVLRFQPKPAELPTAEDPEMRRAPDRSALAVVSTMHVFLSC